MSEFYINEDIEDNENNEFDDQEQEVKQQASELVENNEKEVISTS